MAIQYPDAPQFQVPNLNLMGSFAQGQSLANNALLMQDRERKLADIARTNVFLSQNTDLTRPGLAQRAIEQGIDPTNILGLQKGALEVESERAQMQGRQFDNLAKLRERLQQDVMNVNNQADADALFERYGKIAPDLLPANRMFTPENKRQWMMNTAQFFEASKPYEREYIGPDGKPVKGRFYLNPITQQEVPVGGSERTQAQKYIEMKDAAGNIIGYRPETGVGGIMEPSEFQRGGYMDYMQGREGTGKNPRSSAQGPGQFIDSTFVDTYRKVFPDRAQSMSRDQILAQRGTRIDGIPVEQPMLEAFTAGNRQRLQDAGFAPTKGNTYLSHFLGADGAIDVLSASPDTPVSEILSPKAIKANPEVFAKAKTAGDLIRWAGGGADETPAGVRKPLKSYAPAPIGTEESADQKSALKFLDAIEYNPETGSTRPGTLLESAGGGRPTQILYGLARALGVSTAGTRAEAGLSSSQRNALLAKVGNLGGKSFTDEDRKFVMEALGGLEETAVPIGDRLAKFDEAIRMMANRAGVPYKPLPQLERLRGVATPEGIAPSRGQAGGEEMVTINIPGQGPHKFPASVADKVRAAISARGGR